jgi:hypothetical protein
MQGDIWKLNPPPANNTPGGPPPPGSPRSTQGCTVPYRKYSDNLARPQLPVRLNYVPRAPGKDLGSGWSLENDTAPPPRSLNTVALVDSGADDTAVPLSDARRLGIDLSSLPVTESAGVGNEHNLTYHATVTITVTFCGHEYSYPSKVAFIAGDSSLLGQAGFLDHFRVTLDRTKKQFLIQSVDIQADRAGQSPAEFERIGQRLEELERAFDRLIEIKTEELHVLEAGDPELSDPEVRRGMKQNLDGWKQLRPRLANLPAEKRLPILEGMNLPDEAKKAELWLRLIKQVNRCSQANREVNDALGRYRGDWTELNLAQKKRDSACGLPGSDR